MRKTVLLAALLSAGCATSSTTTGGGATTTTTTTSTTVSTAGIQPARAELRDAQGQVVGTITLTQTPHGVLLSGDVGNLPAGPHAMHFHDVGRCEPPFTSAGGHFNPTGRAHGFRNAAGHHAGDMPNFGAPASGSVRVDHLNRNVTLGAGPTSLFDADGTSLVIHAGADDYATDPAGNSGARIACGVIVR